MTSPVMIKVCRARESPLHLLHVLSKPIFITGSMNQLVG